MTTPIITFSDYARTVGTDTVDPDAKERIRELIEAASESVELETNRRFDRRFEARDYNARNETDGGDIANDGYLVLGDDLITAVDLFNNHTESVAAEDYALFPQESSAPAKWGVKLRGTGYWTWDASLDSFDAIQVYGVWGYGGSFALKTTVATQMDDVDSTTALVVSSFEPFEVGQMIQVGVGDTLEYMLVAADPTTSTLLVQRAYNGTTPVIHPVNDPVYVFRAAPIVRRLVTRVVRWMEHLDDSPDGDVIVIGDGEQVVNLSLAPDDVKKTLERLKRSDRIIGVS